MAGQVKFRAVLFLALLSALRSHACSKLQGKSYFSPAPSCRVIKECDPGAPSGVYVIGSKGRSENRYCDMDTVRCGVRGGWTRVADEDMTRDQSCPLGLSQFSAANGKRLCRRPSTSAGCSSVYFNAREIPFSKICGRVLAYGCGTLDSFRYHDVSDTLDQVYLDGISVTHGPVTDRKHVFSFAADYKTYVTPKAAFVGSSWINDRTNGGCFENKLFTGAPCINKNGCSLSGQPFFCHTVPIEVKDLIEVRLCRDESRSNEDIALSAVELYIY